jgi:hypothetical protein
MKILRQLLFQALGLGLVIGTLWVLYQACTTTWKAFSTIQPVVAAALVAGAATIVGSTAAVMAGRYFERKKELEALYRDKKMPIYSSFLTEIFSRFQGAKATVESDTDLVSFFQEWHRQIVLWGGPEVVNAYLNWKNTLRGGPTARTNFAMDNLIFAIRSELGNVNRGIKSGLFAQMTLRNPDLFIRMAKDNPDIQLSEVAAEEKRLGLV